MLRIESSAANTSWGTGGTYSCFKEIEFLFIILSCGVCVCAWACNCTYRPEEASDLLELEMLVVNQKTPDVGAGNGTHCSLSVISFLLPPLSISLQLFQLNSPPLDLLFPECEWI